MNHVFSDGGMNAGLSDDARAEDTKTVLGFWVYLMTDFVLFASLFAVFIVLRGNVLVTHTGQELFSMPAVLAETLILLTSSLTCGVFLLFTRAGNVNGVLAWMFATLILGASFVGIELTEFGGLIIEGNGPSQSAFLSSFFTLVGTHGLHVSLGILWIITLMFRVVQRGLTRTMMRQLMLLGMFWHFLDIIWIFIFTIVYLIGTV
jgi:cytochrome o ubiquinol oxidase subunit 3